LTNSTTAPIVVTYVYTTTTNTCSGTAQNVTVTVNPTFAPLLSATNGSSACIGNAISVTNAATCIGCTYAWSTGGSGVSTSVIAGTNDYSAVITTLAGCQISTSPISITSLAEGTWLGTTNSWTDPSNWCGGIPTSTGTVIIGNTGVVPVVSGNAIANNITIPTGVTLNITAGNKLTLYGNQTGGGVISGGCSSTLELVGGATQWVGKASVGNVVVNNGNHIQLNGDIIVCNSLTLTNGNIIAGNNVVKLEASAAKPLETATSRIIGRVRAMGRQVGQGSIDILGIQLAAGADDLDTVFVERREAAATFGAFSGIGHTWSIRAHRQPTSGRSIKLNWLPAARNNNNMASVQVWRRPDNGTNWTKVGAKQNLSASVGSYGLWVTTSSFSDWTASGDNNPLPVTWTTFSGQRKEAEVKLSWSVASQQANRGFIVERGENSQQFDSIGFVAGDGNSNSLASFHFTDPYKGAAYYRLRQVDFDGKTSLSNIIYIPIGSKGQPLSVYPNPTSRELYVVGLEDAATLELYNANGKLQLSQPVSGSSSIDLTNLPAGVYLYRITTATDVHQGKVVKQ
jgi:hypothetical protein